MNEIRLVIDTETIEAYNEQYFAFHPRAYKRQIEHPWHPSINQWFVMQRPQLNSLKQKWKLFGEWLCAQYGCAELMLDSVDIEIITYFDTKRRHDVDNYVPKFLFDAFVSCGFIVDDDDQHIHKLTLQNGYDKENPRTEIVIIPK